MRALISTLLALGLAAGVAAQDFTPVTCPDGSTFTPQMTITLPPQSPATPDELPEPYFVSVIPDKGIPTLSNTDENTVVTCAIQDGLAQTVTVAIGSPGLDSLVYGGSSSSAWITADSATDNTIAVGGLSGYNNFIVIEGGGMSNNDDGDIYTFTFDPSVLEYYPSDSLNEIFTFEFALLSTDGTYKPGFSFLDETDEVIETPDGPHQCIPDQCNIGPNGLIGAYTGIRVPLYQAQYNDQPGNGSDLHYPSGQQDPTIRLRVEDTNTEGAYTLIVYFHTKIYEPETIPAQAIDNGDGSWMVRCNGELAFENGLKLTLDTTTIMPETPLTLTALGADSPVTMAVFTSPTEGTCVPPSDSISSYSVTLPELNVAPTLNAAQVTLDAPPAYVLIGSAQPGPLSLLVEGWQTPVRQTLVAEENPDLATILQPVFTLDVTPGLIDSGADVRAYAIAADDLANPVIGILNEAGQPVTDATGQIVACNDAGIPEECILESASLTGYSLTLAEGRVLPGASLDAMVRVSFADLLPQVDAAQPRLHVAAADRTGAGGPMVLLLSLVLGQ